MDDKKVSKEEVLRLANLAKVDLGPSALEEITEDINQIRGFIDKLAEADVDDYAPTEQVSGNVNVFRPDEIVDQQATTEQLVSAAGKSDAGYVVVGRVKQ